ncbi:HD domain-containing protein [Sinimarinibacterium sp. CAU 1509]|uniref:HD-GYP domain-containing protein n=1 Tax=Sinimarinibacterium sp. CAU 1509 TaxID=2562283 RepID=UPI0010ABCE23|nr:HD domain-containing phosphohydrolase [Sinimarinibacterium sp. CAU 1509]TJY59008.1 HD domain-containing protein [Sinimarinibacterium sp. CAU 1509]
MSSVEALNQRLQRLHQEIQACFPAITRVSVALFDPATTELRTFLYSPANQSPLSHYRIKLPEAGWLFSLSRNRKSRILNDLGTTDLGEQEHSRRIASGHYQASYTVPIYDEDHFLGFVFFNADHSDSFKPRVVAQLDLFVHIISLMVERSLQAVTTLTGGMHLLRQISHFRNDETGSHLSRMAYYSELIARELAARVGHDDDWVEHVRLFAPMHDIGKITTPDAILLKPGKLTEAEFDVMRQHPVRGETILRTLLQDLNLVGMPYVEGLLHIARHHHERWDGTGYPDRLSGSAIPVEARIVAVADVFDALTTKRCYKDAWPLERARALLEEGSGRHFDPECVEAFVSHMDQVVQIRERFPVTSTSAT